MLNKECDQKQNNTQETIASKEISSNQEEKSLQFTYKVMTRGFFEILWVSKNSISISKDRDLIKKSSYEFPESDWQELMALLNDIDIKSLPNLEAPTKKHQFDGAAMTTLKISVEGNEFETPIFDNGAPPKTIEAIVNKLLSIKTSVEK
jgi:hypothetical protein